MSPVLPQGRRRARSGNDELCQYDRLSIEGPTLVCPPGFFLDKDINTTAPMCQKVLPPPPVSCPTGTILSELESQFQENGASTTSSHCLKQVQEIPVCPPGMELEWNSSTPYGMDNTRARAVRCKRRVIQDAIDCCSPGFVMTHQLEGLGGVRCVREELIQPAVPSSCTGECSLVKILPVAFACPENNELVDMDSESTPNPRCILTENSSFWQLAERICPLGGVLSADGHHCELREPLPPPSPRCPIGVYDASIRQCVRLIVVPVKRNCPPGTILSPPSIPGNPPDCVATEIEEPLFSCPPGAWPAREFKGACVVEEPVIRHPASVITISPTQQCVPPFEFRDGVCKETLQVPRPLECPPGSVPTSSGNGLPLQCEIRVPAVQQPPQQVLHKPTFLCPPGSQIANPNGMCIQPETHPLTYSCPAKAQLVEGGCLVTTEPFKPPSQLVVAAVPMSICPPNAQLHAQVCTILHESAPSVSCPAEFELSYDNLSQPICVRLAPPTSACPIGSQFQPNDGICVRQVVSPAQVTLREGCMHQSCASTFGTPCAAQVPLCAQ